MKELSIEEKAKRYDEALEKSKILYEPGTITESLCYVFPELKESEDENIRKWCISHFKECINVIKDNDEYKEYLSNKVLAWLEKQGGITKLSEEEQNRFAKCVLSSCAMSFINYLDAHKYEGKMCVSNEECEDIENAFHNAMWDRLHRYYCKYIEKQCEQNPVKNIVEKWKDMRIEVYQQASGNRHEPNYSDDTTKMFSLNDIDEIMKKMSEKKPTDMVEPKFHEGEWITNGDYTWKIVEVKPLDYILQSQEGNIVDDTISHVDEQFHSFTIKDAKDGDVLYSPCLSLLWIFKSIDTVYCGCNLNYNDGAFCGEGYIERPTDAIPSTKEQRDALMKAMADADYTFDFEKKELKKIEED